MTNNPYTLGDRVSIARGDARLLGIVIKTVLARCHVRVGERVFVDDWHDVQPAKETE